MLIFSILHSVLKKLELFDISGRNFKTSFETSNVYKNLNEWKFEFGILYGKWFKRKIFKDYFCSWSLI